MIIKGNFTKNKNQKTQNSKKYSNIYKIQHKVKLLFFLIRKLILHLFFSNSNLYLKKKELKCIHEGEVEFRKYKSS